jgi:RNA polymerase sigma-70 factor (ECF subfamily)
MKGRPLNGSDRDLIMRASQGDIDAFTTLVRDHSTLVYRVALRVLGPEAAQDASQEVWIRVWKSIKGFRGDSAFSTWLYKITMNTCLNARRREERWGSVERAEHIPYLPEPPGGDGDPEASALGSERRQEMQAALLRIRAEHRAALVLRHMEGLSYGEIAAIMEIPDGTAKGWVFRGRAELLVALTEDGYNDGKAK